MFPTADFYQKQKKGILKDPMPSLNFHRILKSGSGNMLARIFFNRVCLGLGEQLVNRLIEAKLLPLPLCDNRVMRGQESSGFKSLTTKPRTTDRVKKEGFVFN